MNDSAGSNGELLSDEECISLLKEHSLGRIGISINALPAILPVVYRIVDDAIVIDGWGSARIGDALVQSVVAFEVDEVKDEVGCGWSVLVIGVASSIEDYLDLSDGMSGSSHRETFVIRPDIISGRRVNPSRRFAS
ncbi:MAG: pyridoxamine 5'-phosphate oxidase family protein [Actinomycetota bacterium]|nr:pyridoxamine 5'-phosphate oxidase family protein [Actinomycetota bacterium]